MNLDPSAYENNGNRYLIGFSENNSNCHLIDGDEFTIQAGAPGTGFTLTYIPTVSQFVSPVIGQNCVSFWSTVQLTYSSTTGILTGMGTENFNGGITRHVSIAIDRSHSDPSVVHIYVSSRTVAAPPPDDGSATGTGKK